MTTIYILVVALLLVLGLIAFCALLAWGTAFKFLKSEMKEEQNKEGKDVEQR